MALIGPNEVSKVEKRVIAAACRWVNVDDQGTIKDLLLLTNAQIELARAVTALQKIRRKRK